MLVTYFLQRYEFFFFLCAAFSAFICIFAWKSVHLQGE